ncbi:unnamed protein product [Lepeophtheirus salmonis]|uniref:(salmon louse) hypothetical protein n=1 Tax=Lepeophtheirus salmonis TaxID=72036 RepID=A0A7R8D6T4_LEPSM|nr:unnamed protein product [Lepeophtheirus salmonis]CAF3047344.1 unnamed protein product [Lepeophtheirus salmonis]
MISSPAKLLSASEMKRIKIPILNAIHQYNYLKMGGVDGMDENISIYRTRIRGKKMKSGIYGMLLEQVTSLRRVLRYLTKYNVKRHLNYKSMGRQKYLDNVFNHPRH